MTARPFIPSVADARDDYLFACWFHAVFRGAALVFDDVTAASVRLDTAMAAESDARRGR